MAERTKSSRALVLAAALVLALFAAGLFRLFALRFQAGDVWPPYSSLRSDPLGAKAFFESLEGLGSAAVDRNFGPLSGLESDRGATVFFLGASTGNLYLAGRDLVRALDGFVLSGGRLVISFLPVRKRPPDRVTGKRAQEAGAEEEKENREEAGREDSGKDREKKAADEKEGEPEDRDPARSLLRPVSLGRHWGFNFDYDQPEKKGSVTPPARAAIRNLPRSVSWHTALHFKDLHDSWRVISTHKGRPVIIERDFGRGTIVLAADSYLFSNEALRREPAPGLLAWMVGPGRGGPPRIIFEETHLGMRERPGLASLARKYRLHGLFIGLIVLAGLFVWKSSLSLVPPSDEDRAGRTTLVASERDYNAGLVSLLRRNVPQRRLLEVCFEEWRKSSEPRRTDYGGAIEEAGAAVKAHQADPVRGYKAVCQILTEGKRKWKRA